MHLPARAKPEDADLARVLRAAQGPPCGAPAGDLLDRFWRHCERAPAAPAVVCHGTALGYGAVGRAVQRLAANLAALGAREEARVGILLERSELLPIAVLATLQAGAAYVPLAVSSPAERNARICRDAAPEVVLTSERLADAVPPDARAVATVEELLRRRPDATAPARPRPRAAAYVLYTSGTTGMPKGVVAERGALQTFASSTIAAFRLSPRDRVLAFADPTFDVSAMEMLCTLSAGASLHVATDEERTDPEELTARLRADGVTVADIPPALLPMLEADGLPAIRLVSVGGEAFPAALALPWTSSGRRFINSYGPTEATVAVTLRDCTGREPGSPPIGRPMPGQQAYVLDEDLRPAPVGVAGELYLGGSQVTRGYLNRPRETAERFVPDPFAGAPGRRLFRTGDRARWTDDDELEFLGRRDRQVKVRGVRIELAEVEAALAEHGDVVQAAAIVRERPASGAQIVAFAVVAAGARVRAEDVLAHAARTLSPFAVPSELRLLAQLPVTRNGKVDMRALATWAAS